MWQFMPAWEGKSCETGEPFIKSKNQVCSQSIKFKFSFQLKFHLEKTHVCHPRVVSGPAFIICCCVTNDLRLVAAWNGQRLFSGSFADQESEGRLAGWFWLRVSGGGSRCEPKCTHLNTALGPKCPPAMVLSQGCSKGPQLLVKC